MIYLMVCQPLIRSSKESAIAFAKTSLNFRSFNNNARKYGIIDEIVIRRFCISIVISYAGCRIFTTEPIISHSTSTLHYFYLKLF